MVELLSKLSNGQLFWVIVIAIIALAIVIGLFIEMILRPIEILAATKKEDDLRDRFAGQALAALITWEHAPNRNGYEVTSISDLCHDAYRYADKMLHTREADEEDNEVEFTPVRKEVSDVSE